MSEAVSEIAKMLKSIAAKLDILTKVNWSYKEIAILTNTSNPTAIKLKDMVINEDTNARVKFVEHEVKRDYVLRFLGTDVEREVKNLKDIYQSMEEIKQCLQKMN